MTISGSKSWWHVMKLNLPIIVEVTEICPCAIKLDLEFNSTGQAEVFARPNHWTLDFVLSHFDGRYLSPIQRANNFRCWFETSTLNQNYFFLSVWGSWLRERTLNSVELEDKWFINGWEVFVVKSKLQEGTISPNKASRCDTHHVGRIPVEGRCELKNMAALLPPSTVNQRPFALSCLEVCNIWKVFPNYEYLCSAVHLPRLGEDVLDRSLVVIAVWESSVNPIDTVLRNGNRKWCKIVLIRRRHTNDSNSRVESSSDNFFTNFTVWHKAILNFKVEPNPWYLDGRASLSQARKRLNFFNHRLLVEVIFNLWIGVVILILIFLWAIGLDLLISDLLPNWNINGPTTGGCGGRDNDAGQWLSLE